MIQVRFQPPPDVPDDKLEAVLKRAGKRVFPGAVDPKREAESEKKFEKIMQARRNK